MSVDAPIVCQTVRGASERRDRDTPAALQTGAYGTSVSWRTEDTQSVRR